MEIYSLRHIFYVILLTTGQCEIIMNTGSKQFITEISADIQEFENEQFVTF